MQREIKSEWISLKERFPEKIGRYLVYCPRYDWIGVSSFREKDSISTQYPEWDISDVTHWMPLPGLPKCSEK